MSPWLISAHPGIFFTLAGYIPKLYPASRPAGTAFDFLASGALAEGVVYSILPAFYFLL